MEISSNYNSNVNSPKFGATIIQKGKTLLPPTVTKAFSEMIAKYDDNATVLLRSREYNDPLYGPAYKIKMMIPLNGISGKIKNFFKGWIPLSNGAHYEDEWVERFRDEYLLALPTKIINGLSRK